MSNGPLPLFLDDLRASTRGWTRAERWSYLGVLDDMWRNGGATAADDASLIEAADLKGEKGAAQTLAKIRSKCALTPEGRLTHPRLAKELQKKRDIANKRAAAGAASAAAKGQQKGQQTPQQPVVSLLGPPTLPIPVDTSSLRSDAPAEAVAPGKPPDKSAAEIPKAPDPPRPSVELDLDIPADLRRKPGDQDPPKPAADRIWGPLREALGLGDADRAFIGKLIRDHGEEAVCGAMALAAKAPPADPKSWLKANLKGGRNGQAEQAQRGNDDSLLARTKALLAERDARLGAGDPGGAADAVLPAVPGGR